MGLAERWYEARKYALSLALLPRERYASAFEPGCSIGVLTAQLAPRCDRLLACDAAADGGRVGPRADRRAARRAGRAAVDPRRLAARRAFDLIVFSELLYYFGDADLDQVLRLGTGALRPDGHLLAVHWRHPAPDYPRTGD